ncbi:hypothetical protein ACHRVK_20735 [Flavobacterium plurextorum]
MKHFHNENRFRSCGARPYEMRSQWQLSFNLTFQFNSTGDLKLKLK